MSISMEVSTTLYDSAVASAIENDAEFAAGVINRIDPFSPEQWIEELARHLDGDGKALLRQIVAALDATTTEA